MASFSCSSFTSLLSCTITASCSWITHIHRDYSYNAERKGHTWVKNWEIEIGDSSRRQNKNDVKEPLLSHRETWRPRFLRCWSGIVQSSLTTDCQILSSYSVFSEVCFHAHARKCFVVSERESFLPSYHLKKIIVTLAPPRQLIVSPFVQ